MCAIARTQGALSTGMLCAGTTALFDGVEWMPLVYLHPKALRTSLPEDWFTPADGAVVLLVLILTFVLPTVVSTAICSSVASTDDQGQPRLARYRSAST